MKFEEQSQVPVGIVKRPRLGSCNSCGSLTRWYDAVKEVSVCGDECLEGKEQSNFRDHFEKYHTQMEEEMILGRTECAASKDIIIVVHNQLSYIKNCIDSIRENTSNYRLYIWDNASDKETADYLQSLVPEGAELVRSEVNLGFIDPNNELAGWGRGEYIVLLNSDCVVLPHWTDAMVGFLKTHPEVAEVGCVGGLLEENGIGSGSGFGYDIDYLHGWCVVFGRQTYEKYGLFNKQLRFAYAEDSDFSLRLKEAGKKIYAFHLPLVQHFGSVTIKDVEREGVIDIHSSFRMNHEYMRLRWKDYLENERIHVKQKR